MSLNSVIEGSTPEGSSARDCPACRSSDYVKRGHKNGFEMLSCIACKTLFTSRLPDAKSAKDYSDYYSEANLTAPPFISQRLDEIIAQFIPYRQTGRLLDVGFGAGTLLEAACRAGWKACGVDVSPRAVKHVRALGFDVVCGTLAEASYPNDSFDVVTASELLEHVADVQELLFEVARVLRPGGLLWLTTPNGRGLSGRLLGLGWTVVAPPEHLQLLSRIGSRKLLVAAGLRPIRVMTTGINPYEIIHGLRGFAGAGASDQYEGRVESSYSLNEMFTASSSRRCLKAAVNGLLNLGGVGDSLKVWAERR